MNNTDKKIVHFFKHCLENMHKCAYCDRTSSVIVGSVEKRYMISRQVCNFGASNSDFSNTDTIVPKW